MFLRLQNAHLFRNEDLDMNKIGQIIANHRKAQKLSQGQVIEKLTELGFPIKKSGYSSWETGVTQPNADQFLAICKVLGITNI